MTKQDFIDDLWQRIDVLTGEIDKAWKQLSVPRQYRPNVGETITGREFLTGKQEALLEIAQIARQLEGK